MVKALKLTRHAISDALRRRRTYAVPGDRIKLDSSVNGAVMRSQIRFARDRDIRARVRGWDLIDRVEAVRKGPTIRSEFGGASRWW